MDTKINPGTVQRIIWFTLLNISIILTLALVTQGAIIGFIPFLLIYAFVMPFISLLFSKRFAKRAYNLMTIEENNEYEDTIEWYRQTTYQICERAGMDRMPEIAIYESDDKNAFATGRSKKHSLIAVSTALLYGMSADAVEAVIAHEVAHIVNGDMVTQTLLQSALQLIIGVIILPITIFKWILLFVVDEDSAFIFYITVFIEFIVGSILFFLSNLVSNTFSRQREFKADHLASQLTGPHKMIRALEELTGPSVVSPPEKRYAALQFNGMKRMLDIFSTHPSIDRRIKYIEQQFTNK